MELNTLQAFVAVARNGSFSHAAEQLFLTQPAVSKRVATLEGQLGINLFDRIGRRVVLTEAGTALLPRAIEIINDAADLKRVATNLSGEVSGSLQLGTSHHIGLHRLPSPLRQFSAKHPSVRLDIRFLDSEAACHSVQLGELEMAIVTLPGDTPDKLQQTVIWNDPLSFVVAAEHELAQRSDLTLETLAGFPAVLPGPTTFTRSILDREITKHNLELTISMSTNYLETIKMLVSINQGWSLLPETMLDEELVALQLPVKLNRQLGIVTHSGRTLSNAALDGHSAL